jgi:hypothetical protein
VPGGDELGTVGVLAAGHVLVDAVEHPALAVALRGDGARCAWTVDRVQPYAGVVQGGGSLSPKAAKSLRYSIFLILDGEE